LDESCNIEELRGGVGYVYENKPQKDKKGSPSAPVDTAEPVCLLSDLSIVPLPRILDRALFAPWSDISDQGQELWKDLHSDSPHCSATLLQNRIREKQISLPAGQLLPTANRFRYPQSCISSRGTTSICDRKVAGNVMYFYFKTTKERKRGSFSLRSSLDLLEVFVYLSSSPVF
jgi:hypothetical protein